MRLRNVRNVRGGGGGGGARGTQGPPPPPLNSAMAIQASFPKVDCLTFKFDMLAKHEGKGCGRLGWLPTMILCCPLFSKR